MSFNRQIKWYGWGDHLHPEIVQQVQLWKHQVPALAKLQILRFKVKSRKQCNLHVTSGRVELFSLEIDQLRANVIPFTIYIICDKSPPTSVSRQKHYNPQSGVGGLLGGQT